MKNVLRKNISELDKAKLEDIRKMISEILSQSVLSLYPTTKLGESRITENGFSYDFDFQDGSIQGEDLKKIEETMRSFIKQNRNINKTIVDIDIAIQRFEEQGETYKVDILKELQQKGEKSIAIYTFGPQSGENTFQKDQDTSIDRIQNDSFKLNNVAGAYRKGDANNKMLTRISGFAFENKEQLQEYLENLEEAKKRDHKKIGPDMERFMFDSNSPGMPYRLPKGLTLKNLLISFWRQYHKEKGYQEFSAPLLAKKTLYETSGHREHYEEDMMITNVKGDDIERCIKPMGCPNACTVFKSKHRSYKELPLRLSDIDTLHRNEITGSLNGLLRVRSFNQDDSHNFVEEDKVGDEIKDILDIVYDFYKLFGLEKDIKLYLSTMPDDHLGEEETWRKIEGNIEGLLANSEFKYGIKEKDGAFYGPKIDIHLRDAFDRERQCGTIQVDYQLPQRFGLKYTDKDGIQKTPVIIHRVIYGSLDRFLGILIEHTGGKMPFWLMPNQIKILPVKETVKEYTEKIKQKLDNVLLMSPLKYNELRYEVDDRNESLGKRIKEAIIQKTPVLIIVGEKESQNNEVTLRINNKDYKISLEELDAFLKDFNENKIE